MQYSRYTWEHFADRYGCKFIHYDQPAKSDMMRFKINWQRWFDMFSYIPDDWDSIMLVDASIMTRWDSPNYFDMGGDALCAMRANENWKWVSESIRGYKDLFPNLQFVYKDYFCSGMVVLRRCHKPLVQQMESFFNSNIDEILNREDVTVLRGRDQPVLNFLTQAGNYPIHHWDTTDVVNHLYRREILGFNWQLNNDRTPFFIKYFNTWQFSGFSDRGDTRTKLMSDTWNLIKSNYDHV